MAKKTIIPTDETHKCIKVCHGVEYVSPVLILNNESFTPEKIIEKLTEYDFVNQTYEGTNTHWFQDLKNDCLVFGTDTTNNTLFTNSLCLVPVSRGLVQDE